MSIIAYSLSDNLNQKLAELEKLRRDIHVAPISKSGLLEMQWSAKITRIQNALLLDSFSATTSEISKVLLTAKYKSAKEEKIAGNNKASDYIRQEWYVSGKKITFDVIVKLNRCINDSKNNASSIVSKRQFKEPFNQLLDYLNVGNDHPVIQAGICYFQIMNNDLAIESKKVVATNHAYVVLYNHGYDYRELLDIEYELAHDVDGHDFALQTSQGYNNITTWLEYFIDKLIHQSNRILKSLDSQTKYVDTKTSIYGLNTRQRNIMYLFDDPKSRITNRQVQKKFGISQITASRDLAKLTSLGALISYGKGRSTWYGKI